MAVRSCSLAIAAILAAWCAPAGAATPATYTFYARVTSSTPGAPVAGTIIPISVTVDTSFPPYTGSTHFHNYYGGAGYNLPSPILAATVNGANAHGIFDSIQVTHNADGSSGITIETYTQDSDLLLTFTATMAGAVKTLNIPRIIFPGNFQSAQFKDVLEERGEVAFSGQIVE